jgi:hypothetical protein
MIKHSTWRSGGAFERRGIALVSVLYFLVVCGLVTTAVLFVERTTTRDANTNATGAQLIAAADEALHSAIGTWNSPARARQPIGSTATLSVPGSASVYVTRLTLTTFSVVAEALSSTVASRRVSILVRMPPGVGAVSGALVSAVGVTVGPQVRFTVDTSSCGDSALAAVVLSPTATLALDPVLPVAHQPSVARDSAAADSAAYLRFGNAWWNDLVIAADVRLATGAHVVPSPSATGDTCLLIETNWGDPTSATAPCGERVPVVYAAGDLTIDGGTGQGVLLVDGRLLIAGPFTYSGQIVARGGIETNADNITISGVVYAWRARTDTTVAGANASDVVLARRTTLRYSRCDARHGVASSLQPRRVRERAWMELF